MGNHNHYHRLTFSITRILTFITLAISSLQIASAQTRIISLSGDLDFGRIPLGTSAQRTLIISNGGDSVLTISNLYYPPEPVLIQVNFAGNFSGPIEPGGSAYVPITFTPIGIAINGGSNDLNFAGYLFVDSDATGGSNSILMTGVGTWPPPTPGVNLDFGSVPLGYNNFVDLILTNIGNTPVTFSNSTIADGFSLPFWSPVTLQPGTATLVFVGFVPSMVTNYQTAAFFNSDATNSALVLVTTNGCVTNSADGSLALGVSGTGTYPSGDFIGLFMPTNNPAFENSGYFTAESSTKGKLRATIILASKRYPFSALISPSATASASIKRKNLPDLNVSLQFGNGFYGGDWAGTIDDGTWTAQLLAEPAPLISKRAGRAAPSGKFTITIAGNTNSSVVVPTSPGTGTLAIKISDATHVSGILGDGTHYSQNTIVCIPNQLPFYASLYGHRGAILGWISFERLPSPHPPMINPIPLASPQFEIVGSLNWFKPAGIDTNYPDGFSFQTTVNGSVP